MMSQYQRLTFLFRSLNSLNKMKLLPLKPFLILICIATGLPSFGQNIDSTTFVNAKWKKQKVAPRTKLFVHHFNEKNLFSANQNISFIEVKNKGKVMAFDIGYEVQELKTTGTFGKENNAIAAINGTFFDVKNGGSVDFIKVNGKVVTANRLEKNNKRALHQKAAVVISNGKLDLKKWDGSEKWENSLQEDDVMLSGPLLSIKGKDETLDSVPFNTLRHPRSAIGIKPNGKVVLLTIDGRHENAAGVNLFELTKIMRWLGCTSAINLDGGGSTALWINSVQGNGIVNYPSDNKKWDHEGSRKVANTILLKRNK